MELVNYTLIWVLEVLDEIMETRPDICHCKRCRYDIAALALNRLKPKYVVSDQGYVYAKSGQLVQQDRTDILAEVVKALELVSKNPRHFGDNEV